MSSDDFRVSLLPHPIDTFEALPSSRRTFHKELLLTGIFAPHKHIGNRVEVMDSDSQSHLADYVFLMNQMAQHPPHQNLDPRNSQQHPGSYHPSHIPPPHQQQQAQPSGHVEYNPPTRTGPMRLDIPPPPVFTTQPSPNIDYPNQYGPPAGFTYQGAPPMTSPGLMPPMGHAGPSTQLYAPSNIHDGQRSSKMYPGSLPTSPYGDPNQPSLEQQQQQHMGFSTYQQPPQLSPYYTPYNQPVISASSIGSNGSAHMQDYFPPYIQGQVTPSQQPPAALSHPLPAQISPPFASPTWQTPLLVTPATNSRPEPLSAGASSQSGGSGGNGPKTSRQQFTACGACRHRRVKCDLKDRQDEAELKGTQNEEKGPGPVRTSAATRKQKVKCTNCHERGMNCV